MAHKWSLRCPEPTGLVLPVKVDPTGTTGPTPGQARGPAWRRTSPGCYVPAGTDGAVVEQRILEASMRLPVGGAVGGWAALRLARGGFFDGLEPDGVTPKAVPLLVPAGRNLRRGPGIVVVRERLDPEEVVVRHGIPCVTALRAVFDEARRAPDLREAVVVIDMAASARLVTLADLAGYVRARTDWRNASQVRAALPLVSDRSRSPAETRMRLVWLLDAGYPFPLCNWPIADPDGRRLGRPDLLCEELAVVGEFDGAGHRDADEQRVDVAKEGAYRNVGLESFRVVGKDLDDIALVTARMDDAVRRAREAGRPRRWMRRTDPGPL